MDRFDSRYNSRSLDRMDLTRSRFERTRRRLEKDAYEEAFQQAEHALSHIEYILNRGFDYSNLSYRWLQEFVEASLPDEFDDLQDNMYRFVEGVGEEIDEWENLDEGDFPDADDNEWVNMHNRHFKTIYGWFEGFLVDSYNDVARELGRKPMKFSVRRPRIRG